MSPEVLCHQNHGIQTDYFALGVICYELLLGRRPYRGRSRRENREHILAKQARIKTKDLKYVEISEEGIDFVNALLIRKPKKRLGANGSDVRIREFGIFNVFRRLRITPGGSPFRGLS